MPDCELITSARALYNLDNRSTSSEEATTLAELIDAVSVAIEKYCGVRFCETQHDELYNGDGQRRLLLRNYPIISVERVAYQPATVLTITNTAAANQRATVSVTDTGLSLTRVASAVSTTDTVSFSSNTTLSAVKTAVDALGNGWSAAVANSNYNNWPSADLRALQGSLNAKNKQAPLRIHLSELTDFHVDAEHGWLLPGALEAGAIPDRDAPGWHGGVDYWRVIYTAGYSTVPEDVQEAAAQWVAALFWQTKRDPALSLEQIPGVVSRSPTSGMTDSVRQLLAPYRKRTILNLRG